jgi:MOSC domain-containing protein YiiM
MTRFFVSVYPSYFTLQVRWLRSLTPVTYLSKLLGIHSLAAFLQLELFRAYKGARMHYPVNVFTGKVRDYDGSRPSAIAKVQVDGELTLTDVGLAGDEQAEKKIHGGPERALCHYPREHYQHWITAFPEQADLFVAPAFGENLSTEGLTENNVFIGDIFRWGDALIQVTQPRSPCFKLNYHFGISDMSARLQTAGKTGWLYRVVLAGQVSTRRWSWRHA